MVVNALQLLTGHFAANTCSDQTFLGLLPWYHYLTLQYSNGACEVVATSQQILSAHSILLLVLLALVDDLLRIVGLLAVIYVIIAGIKYTMSRGTPDEVAKSQGSIINALVGLAISLVAVKFVDFLGNQFSSAAGGASQTTGLDLSAIPNPAGIANGSIVPTILNIIFGLAGAVSFLFLILGGYGYIASRGDPQNVSKAKSTVTYALVGLIVTILAETIVSFIVSKL